MDYITTDTELTSIANAIRTKGGTSGQLVYPNGFVNAIGDISSGTDIGAEDEGKVVHNGELVAQTSLSVRSNGTYDTTLNDEVVVAVSGGGGDAPDKFYIESQDGTVSMLFEKDGDDLRQTVYFNGFTKNENDTLLPSPLDQFAVNSVLITKAYDSANGEWIGNIGFNTSGRARSWTKDNRNTLAGTFWGTLYLVNRSLDPDKSYFVAAGGTVLDVPYEAPVVPSGGGGAKNILSGTEEPSANVGTNGDIYLMYAGEGNSVEISLSKKNESGMGVTIDGDSVSFVYNSGQYIGAQVYQLIDLTYVSKISFTAAIGTHHYGRGSATQFNPVLMLAPQGGTFNPASSYVTESNVTSYGVWTGGEDGTTENVSIDVNGYAGSYYVIFAGTGCTVSYIDIHIGYNEGEIIETYLKTDGLWNPIRLQDIDDVNTGSGSITLDVSNEYYVAEGSMQVTRTDDSVSFAWNGGSYIRANLYVPIRVSNSHTVIRYKLSTGTSYGTKSPRKFCVGLRALPDASPSRAIYDDTTGWIVSNSYDTNNAQESSYELDVSELVGGYILVIAAHGWNATISDIELA